MRPLECKAQAGLALASNLGCDAALPWPGLVARRHEVSRGLLGNWRAQVRSGALVPEPVPVFTPVRITGDVPSLGYPPPALPAPGRLPA